MTILITGGSGFVGSQLSSQLHSAGHDVYILTRKKRGFAYNEVLWGEDWIDDSLPKTPDVVVHLAGEGIASGRWTKKRKESIISSRVNTLNLLSQNLESCKVLVGASGIGFYGGDTKEAYQNEASLNGNDFLAYCCKLWEQEEWDFAEKFSTRISIIRTGLVLSDTGGVLPKLSLPVKYFLGANLGSGEQWLSWIHLDDLINLYISAITDPTYKGVYNAVSNNPARFCELNKAVADTLKRPLFLPNIPVFLLKLILGEMSVLVLGSSRVLTLRDYSIKFKNIEDTISHIYNKKTTK